MTKDETLRQRSIVRYYRKAGCVVYILSQPRMTKQTSGLPDLWVFHPSTNRGWWFETKTPEGTLSDAQRTFAELCRNTGIKHSYGGIMEASKILEDR